MAIKFLTRGSFLNLMKLSLLSLNVFILICLSRNSDCAVTNAFSIGLGLITGI